MKSNHCFSDLSMELIELLRIRPSLGGIKNALQHMWGYFKKDKNNIDINSLNLDKLLFNIQKLAYMKKEKYILESTALSELKIKAPISFFNILISIFLFLETILTKSS